MLAKCQRRQTLRRLSTAVIEEKSKRVVYRIPQSTTSNSLSIKDEVEEPFFLKNALKKPKFLQERLEERSQNE